MTVQYNPAQSVRPDLHLRGKLVLNVMSWSQGQTYNGMKHCVEDPGMPIGLVKNVIECLVAVFPAYTTKLDVLHNIPLL